MVILHDIISLGRKEDDNGVHFFSYCTLKYAYIIYLLSTQKVTMIVVSIMNVTFKFVTPTYVDLVYPSYR